MAAALGILVGLVLGLTGAGGSIFAVPALMLALGWTLPQAAPVALLAVAVATAFGTVVAWNVTYIRYKAATLMGVAGWLAAPLGFDVARRVPAGGLQFAFVVVMVIVAARLWRQAGRAPAEAQVVRAAVNGDGAGARGPVCRLDPATGRIAWTWRCAAVFAAIGATTGFAAGLLGVGGGFIIVPALRMFTALSMHSAVATSLMTIALTATGAVVIAGLQGQALPVVVALPFMGGTLAGMLAGRWLAPRIAGPRLQRAFAALMIAVAAGMAAHAAGIA